MTGHGHDSAGFSVRTKNLRALLSWLGVDPGAVEETLLRDFAVEGRLRLDGSGIWPDALQSRIQHADFAFEEVRGSLDGARIAGRLARRKGLFDARVTAEDLPLDPYRPMFDGHGLNPASLHLDLARTRLFGVPAERLELDAELRESGELVVSRLAVEEAGGLSGEASGRFGDEAVSFRVSALTTDLDRSARLYGFTLPAVARGLGAVSFEGEGEGTAKALPVELRADAGSRQLRLEGEFLERKRYRGRIELQGLLPASLRMADGQGPAVLTASVQASRDRADFDDIEIRHGTLRAHGQGSISLDGPRPAARVALATARIELPAPSRDIPVWRRRPLETAPFGDADLDFELSAGTLGIGDEELDDLRLNLSLAPEAWVLKAGGAGWRGGRLAFDGYLTGEGRTLLKFRLRDAVLPDGMNFGPAGARMDGFLALEAEGRSPRGLVSTLSGMASFNFSGGRLAGIDPAATRSALEDAPTSAEVLRRLRDALMSGGSPLISGRLEARIRDGVARPVVGSFALAGGQVAVSGSADLGRRLLDLNGRLAFPDRPDTPPLGFSVAGPLGSPDRRADVGAIEAVLLSEGVAGLVR